MIVEAGVWGEGEGSGSATPFRTSRAEEATRLKARTRDTR